MHVKVVKIILLMHHWIRIQDVSLGDFPMSSFLIFNGAPSGSLHEKRPGCVSCVLWYTSHSHPAGLYYSPTLKNGGGYNGFVL